MGEASTVESAASVEAQLAAFRVIAILVDRLSIFGAAIERGEDRDLFRETMLATGLRVPHSAIARTLEEARVAVAEIGLPVIIRPAFTLGGALRGGRPRRAARR